MYLYVNISTQTYKYINIQTFKCVCIYTHTYTHIYSIDHLGLCAVLFFAGIVLVADDWRVPISCLEEAWEAKKKKILLMWKWNGK